MILPLGLALTLASGIAPATARWARDQERRILAEGQYKQLGLHPTYLVRLGADRILTLGAEGFGKGKAWPILIEFGKDVKK